jgi:hypothetical protein
MKEAHMQYEKDKSRLLDQIKIFKSNKFTESWQPPFLWVANGFQHYHPEKCKENPSSLEAEKIPSSWLGARVAYDQYILENSNPSESDLGDFLHLSYLPYCTLAICARVFLIFKLGSPTCPFPFYFLDEAIA